MNSEQKIQTHENQIRVTRNPSLVTSHYTPMRTHLDLDVWKKSIQFVKKIYEITSKFPDTEKYGLTNQMRRCAVSIPSNIAEGAGRNSKKEFKQFLYISLGSISEIETQLIISTELSYLKDKSLLEELNEIRKMLFGLIKSIKI